MGTEPLRRTFEADLNFNSLMAQCLNCCTAAKIVLMTKGSIPGSRLEVDSALCPSKVGKTSTQLAGGAGGAMHSLHN